MKKLNKLVAILVAMAMMLTLGVVSAFANPVTSTEAGIPVKTKLTKKFDKADGVSDPTGKNYNFEVKNTAKPDDATAIEDAIVILNDTNALTVEDILANTNFTKAGKYSFTVTEKAPLEADGYTSVAGRVGTKVETTDDGKYTTTETVTYSQAEYKVDVVVASYTANASAEPIYYVQSVALTLVKDDAGDTKNQKPDDADEADGMKMTFTNDVNKEIKNNKPGETTETEDAKALTIKKTVTDNETDPTKKADANQEFNFKATIKWPDNSEIDTYTAVIKGGDADGTKTVTFTKGADKTGSQTFKLKAGQWLAFTDIEAGAKLIALTEDTVPGFTTSDEIKEAANYVTVHDNANDAKTVNNTWDYSAGSVTGILMSNIPYIVLALVAIGGLCAYVVVRRKNANEA